MTPIEPRPHEPYEEYNESLDGLGMYTDQTPLATTHTAPLRISRNGLTISFPRTALVKWADQILAQNPGGAAILTNEATDEEYERLTGIGLEEYPQDGIQWHELAGDELPAVEEETLDDEDGPHLQGAKLPLWHK